MIHKLLLSFVAAGVALTGAQAFAQPHSALPAKSLHQSDRNALVTALRLRLASVNARIDMLRDRDALGSAEAQDLMRQSRRLQGRLHGLSARDSADVQREIDLLERQVAFAMDDARWGGHAFNRGFLDRRQVSVDRYKPHYDIDRNDDYRHFDRYTGSSVDGWHDPFDRGNNP